MPANELYIMEVMEQTMADGPGFRTSIYCASASIAARDVIIPSLEYAKRA